MGLKGRIFSRLGRTTTKAVGDVVRPGRQPQAETPLPQTEQAPFSLSDLNQPSASSPVVDSVGERRPGGR